MTDSTPPNEPSPASPAPSPASPAPSTPEPRRAGVGLGALIGVGIGVVLLSFVAAFLGASLARSTGEAAPAPTTVTVAAPVPTPKSSAEIAQIIKDILPAGSAVRAGTGAPAAGKGYEGDVYIDISTADVYVFRDGAWELAGNIRQSAAENLTGAPGAAGASGAPGRRLRSS